MTEERGCTEVLGVTNEECHQLFAMSAMMSVFSPRFFYAMQTVLVMKNELVPSPELCCKNSFEEP